jgi:uncharacterized protein with PhoU and TrkA domain
MKHQTGKYTRRENIYNKKYLKDCVYILKDAIYDLSMWSVYNDDELSYEVSRLNEIVETIKNNIQIDWEIRR